MGGWVGVCGCNFSHRFAALICFQIYLIISNTGLFAFILHRNKRTKNTTILTHHFLCVCMCVLLYTVNLLTPSASHNVPMLHLCCTNECHHQLKHTQVTSTSRVHIHGNLCTVPVQPNSHHLMRCTSCSTWRLSHGFNLSVWKVNFSFSCSTGYKLVGSHSGVKLCRWTKVGFNSLSCHIYCTINDRPVWNFCLCHFM